MSQPAPILCYLDEMQRLTDDLRHWNEARKALEELKAQNKQSLAAFDTMLQNRKVRIDDTQRFIDEKHNEIKEAEETLRTSRTKMGTVSSQRELTALSKELDLGRRATTARNDELKKLEAELVEAKKEFEKCTAEREELANEMAQLESAKQQEVDQHAALGEHSQQRFEELRKAILAIDPMILSRFNRIAKARDGHAVADVTPQGTCAACNISLPPQVFLRVVSGESVETCSNCQRILISRSRVNGLPPEMHND